MVKKIIFFICIVTLGAVEGSVSFAQEEKKQFIRKGLLRATATISPGYFLKTGKSTISLPGNLEYYVSDNISLRGDINYDLRSNKGMGNGEVQYNHSLLSGASYHFKTKNHLDPYIGLQPGLALVKRPDFSHILPIAPVPDYYNVVPVAQVNPILSPYLGFNFYFENWFHLFMETRYLHGRHISTDGAPTISLCELRFSFGLGFNLNLLKKK